MSAIKVKRATKRDMHINFWSIVTEFQLSTTNLVAIAEEAEVSVQTLCNWRDGKVFSPNTRTLFAVAEVMGYTTRFTRRGSLPKHLRRLYSVK